LTDAELDQIPSNITKIEMRKPISKFGIDRITLTNSGIPNEEVSHLYRGLFVYSLGFFSLIKDIIAKKKAS